MPLADTQSVPETTRGPRAFASWQFHLRHVFELTTWAALAATLVRLRGIGTLVASLGLLVIWLNRRGAFRHLQDSRPRNIVLFVSWFAFLVSLVLPSIDIFNPVLGGMAAWLAFSMPIVALWEGKPVNHWLVFYLSLSVANLLMLLLPLLIWRLSLGRGRVLAALLCLTMALPWSLSVNAKDLLIGYYVWSASLALALLGLRLSTTLAIAMAAEALLVVLLLRS